MIPIPNLLTCWKVGWGLGIQPKILLLDRDKHPVGLAFQMPVFPSSPQQSFGWKRNFWLQQGLKISTNPSVPRNIEFVPVLSYHIRPGGTILAEQDFNIPVANELIFGGAVGLKPFRFGIGGTIGHNKMDWRSWEQQRGNGGIKIHSGRHIALNFGWWNFCSFRWNTWLSRYLSVVFPDPDPNVRDPDNDGIPSVLMNVRGSKRILTNPRWWWMSRLRQRSRWFERRDRSMSNGTRRQRRFWRRWRLCRYRATTKMVLRSFWPMSDGSWK